MYYLPPPPYCVLSSIEQLRTVNHVNVQVDPPTLLTTTHWVWALKPDGRTEFRQHVDTQDPGTTTGPIRVIPLNDLGAWMFRFQSVINTTNCNLQPGMSELLEHTVNALKCEPIFLDDNGNVPHISPPPAPDKVQVFLDPVSMSAASAALAAAVNAWNSNVSSTGITFEPVSVPCGTGPRCISVELASIQSCGFASWDPPDPNTGAHTGGLRLRVHTSWNTWSGESLQRTFTHELGHFLGPDNYTAACGSDDAVMQPDFVCSPSATPLTTPTVNDYLPVRSAVYGGKTKTTCGF